MNGLSFVADTNFLIDVHEGKPKVVPFLDGTVIVSVISEIELLDGINFQKRRSKNYEIFLEIVLFSSLHLKLET
jgi:predicted nucleic acid-binding protein